MNVGSLRHEERRHSHVQAAAVGVECVTRWHHQADQRLRAAQLLHFFHQRGQCRVRGTGGQHNNDFFFDVPQELNDVEAGNPGDDAHDHQHENKARDIEDADQFYQRAKRTDPVTPYRKGHRSEGAYGGQPHQHVDDAEHRLRQRVEKLHDRFSLFADERERKAEQNGYQQHLEDVALREGVHHGRRDDVHQEILHALFLGGASVGSHRFGVERRDVYVESGAGVGHVAHKHPGEQRKRGHYLEIQEGLAADAPNLLQIFHARDAAHHGAENDDRDHHGNQLDEAVAERLHFHRGGREILAVDDRQSHADQHLPPKRLVEGLLGLALGGGVDSRLILGPVAHR